MWLFGVAESTLKDFFLIKHNILNAHTMSAMSIAMNSINFKIKKNLIKKIILPVKLLQVLFLRNVYESKIC